MKKIILITGGQRSGKSTYAEQMALSLSDSPVYIATAHIWDEEFRERVRRHQERRGLQWTNIEEEKYLSHHDVSGRVVLIDCLTLWATNFFFEANTADTPEKPNTPDTPEKSYTPDIPVDTVLNTIKEEFERFTSQEATFIFVTNEIGMGGTSSNAVQRRFTDLLGWLNQYVASQSDEVTLMVSGIPVRVKG